MMANEKVGAIFEIIDDATPKLQSIKASVTEVKDLMNEWGKQTDKADNSQKGLIERLGQLNARVILTKIGILAMITAIIKWYSASMDAARASTRLKEELQSTNEILDIQSSKLKTLSEDYAEERSPFG